MPVWTYPYFYVSLITRADWCENYYKEVSYQQKLTLKELLVLLTYRVIRNCSDFDGWISKTLTAHPSTSIPGRLLQDDFKMAAPWEKAPFSIKDRPGSLPRPLHFELVSAFLPTILHVDGTYTWMMSVFKRDLVVKRFLESSPGQNVLTFVAIYMEI